MTGIWADLRPSNAVAAAWAGDRLVHAREKRPYLSTVNQGVLARVAHRLRGRHGVAGWTTHVQKSPANHAGSVEGQPMSCHGQIPGCGGEEWANYGNPASSAVRKVWSCKIGFVQ